MTQPLSRRDFLVRTAVIAGAGALVTHRAAALPPAQRITVYKDPQCGCCKAWNAAMTKAGFALDVRDTADLRTVKGSLGVPDDLASCHTGVAGGYLFEGHVPPDLVQKVLRERPALVGLFVPGMPAGSVGMESPSPERYEIIALGRDQRRSVYTTRMGKAPA
ncbi:MAG TPA: DUF411 domain-containing protein [Gemmatimonadaceae bacterium]|nr:DUF411 domain-containing protein [Gemmatimonadaceae bacterium]